jgi:uncharacterized membrane protein YgcG
VPADRALNPPLAADAARQVASRLVANPAGASVRPPTVPGAAAAPLRFPELQLWAWLLTLKAEAAGRQAVGQVAPLASGSGLQQPFSVFCRIGVLPEDSPSAVQRMLTLAAAQARTGQRAAAVQLLDDLIDRLQEDFEAAGPAGGAPAGPPPSPCLVPACVYAQLLDLCEDPFADLTATPSSTGEGSSSSGGGEGSGGSGGEGSSGGGGGDGGGSDLRRLVEFQIRARTKDAPKDSLAAPAAAVARLLGEGHPVARALAEAAEANMSLAARQARELRQQQATLAASMEVLKVGMC